MPKFLVSRLSRSVHVRIESLYEASHVGLWDDGWKMMIMSDH